MRRRTFLSLLPISLVGGFRPDPELHTFRPEGPEARLLPTHEEAVLLDVADRHLRQMHEIVRRWWRHPEAQREATAFLECLAEAWCRRNGSPPKPSDTQWRTLARRRPDHVTGVPWREAEDALHRLDENANRLVPWCHKASLRAEDVEYDRIPLSLRDVQRALDVLTRCDAAVRG